MGKPKPNRRRGSMRRKEEPREEADCQEALTFQFIAPDATPGQEAFTYTHLPVMPAASLEYLALAPGQVVVDGTLGLAGHSRLFAQAIAPNGTLIGLDRDPQALAEARARLEGVPVTLHLLHTPYSRMREALATIGLEQVDRIFLDIGVSSFQLDAPERGFSFLRPGPLDMRMNPGDPVDAAHLVATLPEKELAEIFFRYGEERFSRRIAKTIVVERGKRPIKTTEDLAELVRGAVPGHARYGRIHPATRVFQALRIAVNDELGELERGLETGFQLLRPGGRMVVITFHSLEDRMVKQTLRRWAEIRRVGLPSRKAVKPDAAECAANRRARSAKLRVFERLEMS